MKNTHPTSAASKIRSGRAFLTAAGFGLVYLLAARASLFFVVQPESLAVIWPPSGLAVAVLLLNQRRDWWKLLLALLCANILANSIGGGSLPVSIAFGLANCVEAALVAFLVDRFRLSGNFLGSFADIQRFLLPVLVGGAITALLGAAVPVLFFGADFWQAWWTWWVSNGLGIMIVTPLILVWGQPQPGVVMPKAGRILEGLLVTVVTIAASIFLFFNPFEVVVNFSLRAYIVYPLLIWLAFRFERRFVVCLMALIVIMAVAGTTLGLGQFSEPSQILSQRLITVQIFMGIVVYLTYSLIAILSELQRDRAALKQQSDFLGQVINTMGQGLAVTDTERRFELVNPACANLLGYAPEALIGLRPMDLTVPEYRPALEEYRERRLKGEITTYESQLLRANGSMVPALVSSSPREINGKYAGSIVVFTDLTEIKQAEKLRRESEERFSTIFHSSPEAIVISRLADGCIVDVNEAFCSLIGLGREQIIGKSGRDLNFWVDNADRDRIIAAMRANGMANAVDIQIRSASGRIGSAIMSGVIIHITGVEHLLFMGIDITPRKQAEAKLLAAHAALEQRVIERTAELQAANTALEKASRAKDDFLATMSHELRTPLTGILGLSQSLQFSTYGPLNEKQMNALKNIEKSGWHLQELINEILDITKLQAGKLDLQIRACSLGSICTSSLQMVDDQARKKKQEVIFSISPETITLQADERRLRQIVINLLSNAVKFTPEGGSIELAVCTLPEKCQARISVKDSGIGIKEEDLPHLFQPFQQLDARLSREYNGTGLGLALVKRLVELHGGSVEVESVFGQGSTFTVSLPWQPEP